MIAAKISLTCVVIAIVLNFINDKVVVYSRSERIIQTLFAADVIAAVISALIAIWML